MLDDDAVFEEEMDSELTSEILLFCSFSLDVETLEKSSDLLTFCVPQDDKSIAPENTNIRVLVGFLNNFFILHSWWVNVR